MQTAQPFVPQPSASEAETAVGMLKRCKAPGVDQIPAELIQAGQKARGSEIHNRIKLIRNKKRMASPQERVNYCTYSQKG
jgi:hypothetical protein